MRTTTRLGALLAALVLLVGCTATPSTEPTDRLEVLSWWTSGSEKQAFDTYTAAYRSAHPDVDLSLVEVAGGGGSNARVTLAERLSGGTPPDVWQTFPGGALAGYVRARQVADLTEQYDDGMRQVPGAILDGLAVDGKQYGVPTGAHRGNVLFYNRQLLARAGITQPATTLDGWLADLDTLKTAGATPLCLGGQDAFTTPAVLENVLLATVGAQGWDAIRADRFDWRSADARRALQAFSVALDHADPQAGDLSWDAAARKLADGGCAYLTMNDSAYAELVRTGASPDTTFGVVPFPGTGGVYDAVVDTFVVGASSANGTNAYAFVKALADPAAQVRFAQIKGSVPVRTDADVSSLSPYQQQAARSLRTDPIVWSIVHGSATTPRFQQGFYDATQTYAQRRDPAAFAQTLADAVAPEAPRR